MLDRKANIWVTPLSPARTQQGRSEWCEKAAGFTLLEILIAVFIVGIISVMMLRGLETAINTKNHLEKNATRLQNLEFAMSLLNNDLENMLNQPIKMTDGTPLAAVLLHTDNAKMLEFTRGGVSNPLGEFRTTLLRVGYAWQDGQLTRTIWSTVNRTADTQVFTRVLVNGVTNLQWQFLGQGKDWTQTWLATSNMPLPRAVQITLQIKNWGEISRIFLVNAQPAPATPFTLRAI